MKKTCYLLCFITGSLYWPQQSVFLASEAWKTSARSSRSTALSLWSTFSKVMLPLICNLSSNFLQAIKFWKIVSKSSFRVQCPMVQFSAAASRWTQRRAMRRCWQDDRWLGKTAVAGEGRPSSAGHEVWICGDHLQSGPEGHWGFCGGLCRGPYGGRYRTGRRGCWRVETGTTWRSGAPGQWLPYSAGTHWLFKGNPQTVHLLA